MFEGKVIAFFFIAPFALFLVTLFLDNKKTSKAMPYLRLFHFISSLYLIVAGIFLAAGWHDPLSNATAHQIARNSAAHGGKGGLIILAIRYWPYFLICVGGYFSYYAAQFYWGEMRAKMKRK